MLPWPRITTVSPIPSRAVSTAATLSLRDWRQAASLSEIRSSTFTSAVSGRVATSAKQDPKIGVVLVGKADRAGSDQYNMRLSQRRADAVRDALIRDGVPRDRIETRWVGEREPPVPTPDNVREPRNRVVEINLR